MITRITYTDDVLALTQRALALYNEGRFHNYISLNPEDETKVIVHCMKTPTIYADGTLHSVSNCVFPERDVTGDPDAPEYQPFFEAVGMECLASGLNRGGVECPYYKIEHGDAETLAKYETVNPRIDILDAEGNPTGETRFNKGVEWDR
jgi:hypothetical protein